MKINLTSLVLEITRRCNMKCAHCLRGRAQPIDMDFEIIDRVTKAVNYISHITFPGGEPSLNAKAIEHFRWSLYFNKCGIDSFWLKVNARFFKQDFYDAISELYSICNMKEDSSLVISGDQYHYGQSKKAIEMYGKLPFFSYFDTKLIQDEQLLFEGLAAKNQIGWRQCKSTEYSA